MTAQYPVIAVILLVAVIVIGRFEMLCLRDLAQTADADLQHLTRGAWAALILLAIPLGGIAYLYAGKAR